MQDRQDRVPAPGPERRPQRELGQANAPLQELLCDNPRCPCHRALRQGRGSVHCPLPGHRHNDRHPSLGLVGLDAKGRPIVGQCFLGHPREQILAHLRRQGIAVGQDGARPRGLRLADLARAKGLPVDFLTSLGWADTFWPSGQRGGTPAVTIPYRDQAGQVVARRYRLALDKGDGPRFKWQKGAKVLPYGLERLGEAKEKGFVLLVEGEADSATLWHAGVPALGLPGKASWRPEWARYLEGIERVYLWREPDAHDLPGRVAQDRPDLLVIDAPAYARDANQLWRFCNSELERFRRRLEQLMAAARPAADSTQQVGDPAPRKGPRGRVSAHTLAVALEEEAHFARDPGDRLYVYADGAYRPYGEQFVRRRVRELLEAWGQAHRFGSDLVRNTILAILARCPTLWQQPPLLLNLRNGVLDVSTGQLHPHNPQFLSPVQLPVTYDPSATCPEIEAFCRQVFPADAYEAGLPWQLVAWLMLPHPWPQKAVLLLGEGGTGKSTFLALLREFLGKENTAALSLQRLESDRFAVGALVGKLANICPDLPSQHLATTAIFKALTGGDEVAAEHKYRDVFRFRPYARLIFSANHPPRAADASEAFFDRWLVIPFERRFRGTADEVPQPILLERLTRPEELSGLLNKALSALPQLRERGFTITPSMQAAWRELRETTDPVGAWLDDATYTHPEAAVSKRELFRAYARYAAAHALPTITIQEFGRRLRELRPQVQEGQRRVAGRAVWCWLGLGLLGQQQPPDPGEGPRCIECNQPADYTEEATGSWWCWRHGPTPLPEGEEPP